MTTCEHCDSTGFVNNGEDCPNCRGGDDLEVTHSPLPWKAKESNDGILILKPNGTYVAELDGNNDEVRANAAFIVKAVNCHEKLLEAAEAGLRVCDEWEHDEQVDLHDERERIEAAIARAKGGE